MESPEDILAEMQPQLTHAEVATNNQMFRELTAELATDKLQLNVMQKQLEDANAEAAACKRALDNLVECIEIDGSLIHGDQCFCDVCEAISTAKAALQENAG